METQADKRIRREREKGRERFKAFQERQAKAVEAPIKRRLSEITDVRQRRAEEAKLKHGLWGSFRDERTEGGGKQRGTKKSK